MDQFLQQTDKEIADFWRAKLALPDVSAEEMGLNYLQPENSVEFVASDRLGFLHKVVAERFARKLKK